jgi:UDP-N-acetyl-D-mannosaminuronic acid dehydrogenase
MLFNTISVIGLGYIGLPTAAMFASNQKKVIGVDVNQNVVDTINAGKIHIVEPDVDLIIDKAIKDGFLKAVTSPQPADAFIIAVPTPFMPKKNKDSVPEPDLTFIEAAVLSVAKVLKRGNIIVLESTSPVGATEKMASWLAEARPDLSFPQTHGIESDIRLAYCPERVLPGQALRELVENDRIIGGMSERCSNAAIELYKIFVKGECVKTNTRTAEMAKLTENASRDVGIAFANELSMICHKLDLNVWDLITLANRHPRVSILQPGPGVGGHCIPIDPWFIVDSSPLEARLIKTARQINDLKPLWIIERVKIAITDCLQSNPQKKRR